MVRRYAQYMGIAIVLVGVAGLLLGDQALLGQLNIDLAEDLVHLITGGLMAYVGFRADTGVVRAVVGGLGGLYLLVFLLGLVAPDLFGLLPHGYHFLDYLIHLALGVLGVAVAWAAGRRAPAPGRA